ncbi:hypothetical protein QCA50_018134 [Cerrena zonata]|uniref:Uncharacterized protein n=1 Tax=Cerrena zonata TaxID=2478898 RepID=A0AAW0FBL6_9APHY
MSLHSQNSQESKPKQEMETPLDLEEDLPRHNTNRTLDAGESMSRMSQYEEANSSEDYEKQEANDDKPLEEIPDGGRGWLVVLGVFLLNFGSWGANNGSGLNITAQNSNPNTHNISNSPQMPENVHDLIDVPEGEGREIEGEKSGNFEFGSFDPFELNHGDEPPLKKTKVEEYFIPSNDKSPETNEPEDSKKDDDLVVDEASVTKSHEIKPEDDSSLQIDSLIPDGIKDNSSNDNPELQMDELVSSSDKTVHSQNKDSEPEANSVPFENNDKLQVGSFIPENINHLDPKAEKSVDTIEPSNSSEENNGETGTKNVQEKPEDHISLIKEGSQNNSSAMQNDQPKDGITSQHEEWSHPTTKPDESQALIESNKQKILQHEQASMNEATSESAIPTEAPLTHDPVQKPLL